jgi:hypothetical protein
MPEAGLIGHPCTNQPGITGWVLLLLNLKFGGLTEKVN